MRLNVPFNAPLMMVNSSIIGQCTPDADNDLSPAPPILDRFSTILLCDAIEKYFGCVVEVDDTDDDDITIPDYIFCGIDEQKIVTIFIYPHELSIIASCNDKHLTLSITPDQYTDMDDAITDIVLTIKEVAPKQWLKKYNKRIAEERDYKIDEILAD
jgi:hypothetical protein